MTAAQQATVDQLKSEGFTVTQTLREIVRMVRGADIRIVKADGIIIRGHHHSLPPKARRKGERV
jgi:hypothetical protein